MKKKIRNVIMFFILLISSICIIGSLYYRINYPNQEFDQILYYLVNGVEHTSESVVNNVIFSCIIPVVILFTILYVLTFSNDKKKLFIKRRKKDYKIQIYPIEFIANHKAVYALIVFVIAMLFVVFNFKIHTYIKNMIQDTELYEKTYVDGRNINITFPEEKRNLIIIIAESMENTVLSKANGGAWEYSIIPELEELAKDNTNFSHNESIGGALETHGTNFSAGGIVGMTAGIPLKTVDILKDKNQYNGSGKFVDGAYALGEILKEQGYNLEVMMGSEATFGGREQYFKTNGDYKVYDFNYAIEIGKMTLKDKEWWGFEDDKLFKWSKEEITELSKQDKPFNYIMITADTHFEDGYLSKNAEKKFDSQYENVYAYSSKSIYEFVEWVKEQEFYENTTIVILGDHLGMQTDFYEDRAGKDYLRTVYNVIINPAIERTNNVNRQFTIMDMYPTILASIGAEIEGNRLGLGTNLYSGVPTLTEELGFDYFNDEMKKYSTWYNENILGEDYHEMIKGDNEGSEVKDEENNNNNTSV